MRHLWLCVSSSGCCWLLPCAVQVGTRALRDNMTTLGPLVLPLSEKLLFAGNMITRQLSK